MIKQLPCLLASCLCIPLRHVLCFITSRDVTKILVCENVKQYATLNKYLITIATDILTYNHSQNI